MVAVRGLEGEKESYCLTGMEFLEMDGGNLPNHTVYSIPTSCTLQHTVTTPTNCTLNMVNFIYILPLLKFFF